VLDGGYGNGTDHCGPKIVVYDLKTYRRVRIINVINAATDGRSSRFRRVTDTADGTGRAERLGIVHADRGLQTGQGRDESVRGRFARRSPGRVRPGRQRLVPSYVDPYRRPTGDRRRRRGAVGMRDRIQVTVVRVLHVHALAQFLLGFVEGPEELHRSRHGPRKGTVHTVNISNRVRPTAAQNGSSTVRAFVCGVHKR